MPLPSQRLCARIRPSAVKSVICVSCDRADAPVRLVEVATAVVAVTRAYLGEAEELDGRSQGIADRSAEQAAPKELTATLERRTLPTLLGVGHDAEDRSWRARNGHVHDLLHHVIRVRDDAVL
jgi:hypothetical protein